MPYWHFWMPYISSWNIYRDTPNSNYYEQIKIIRWFKWRNKRGTRFLTPDVRRFNDFSTTDTVKITAKFAPAVPREILPGAWARQDLCAIVSPGIMHSNCAPEEGRKEERENKKKRKKRPNRLGHTIDREEKKSPLDSRGKREGFESALVAYTRVLVRVGKVESERKSVETFDRCGLAARCARFQPISCQPNQSTNKTASYKQSNSAINFLQIFPLRIIIWTFTVENF